MTKYVTPAERFRRSCEWLKVNTKSFEGKWIALWGNELLGSDYRLNALRKSIKAHYRLEDVLFWRVPRA